MKVNASRIKPLYYTVSFRYLNYVYKNCVKVCFSYIVALLNFLRPAIMYCSVTEGEDGTSLRHKNLSRVFVAVVWTSHTQYIDIYNVEYLTWALEVVFIRG
jgi:hypothetical protein